MSFPCLCAAANQTSMSTHFSGSGFPECAWKKVMMMKWACELLFTFYFTEEKARVRFVCLYSYDEFIASFLRLLYH